MNSPQFQITKQILDNGLTVLILEKHDVPIVTSTIWYKVGSVNEHKGQTGISHFLEHLLFKGTHTYAKGEIDFLTSAYGGNNNAGTIFDYTMYYFNFSSDRWDIALQIEADRMQNCLFDPDEFEAERQVILEEFKQQQDSPWGVLGSQLEAMMFQVHPYHHTPIGWQEDIEQISRDAVMEYYRTYYVPNNAVVVIVGDIETPAAIEKVQQYFGQIPPKYPTPEVRSCEPPQLGERRFQLFQDTNLKRLQIGYHSTTLADPDNIAFEVIDCLLSEGKTSRLYQRLVEKEEMVTFVDTCHHPRKFPGVFYIFAALRPGIAAQDVERVLDEELARLCRETVSSDELQKVKNILAADFLFDKETTSELAHALGEYELLHASQHLNTFVDEVEQITPDDILRVAQTYLTPNNRTVGWSLPSDPDRERNAITAVQSGDEEMTEEMFSAPPDEIVCYKHLASRAPRNFFQEKRFPGSVNAFPAASSSPLMFTKENQRFQHHRWTLNNGLTILFLENHILPIVAIDTLVDAGQRYETDENAGIGVLTGQLLDEGTTKRTGFEIAQAIESVGGALETHSRGVSTHTLVKDFALALDLASDALIHPIFDPEHIEKQRARLLASIEGDEDHLSLVAGNLFHEMVYGTHPYHRPRKGYKHAIQRLTRQEIVEYHQTYFRPNNAMIAIVGDLSADDVFAQVQQYFGAWESRALPPQSEYVIPKPNGCVRKQIYRDKEQCHIYLGHQGITRTDPDFYTLLTLDHILGTGPGFTDRISKTLRDEQGLAYTVFANIAMSAEIEPGTFAAYIGTSPQNTERAIDGLLQEIRTIRTEPVEPEELELAKNYLTGSYVFNFETSSQLARYLITVERFRLGDDFLWQFPQLIKQITIEDIQRVAQQYLDPQNYYIAIVGKHHE